MDPTSSPYSILASLKISSLSMTDSSTFVNRRRIASFCHGASSLEKASSSAKILLAIVFLSFASTNSSTLFVQEGTGVAGDGVHDGYPNLKALKCGGPLTLP